MERLSSLHFAVDDNVPDDVCIPIRFNMSSSGWFGLQGINPYRMIKLKESHEIFICPLSPKDFKNLTHVQLKFLELAMTIDGNNVFEEVTRDGNVFCILDGTTSLRAFLFFLEEKGVTLPYSRE